MKIIKKYTAIKLAARANEDGEILPILNFGSKSVFKSPEFVFDNEDEAIEFSYKSDKWANWLILPLISFDNFD